MEFNVIGFESVNYTNKQGNNVSGVRLHLTYSKDRCEGLAVEQIFCSSELASGICVGDLIEVFYNKYGRVAVIKRLEV